MMMKTLYLMRHGETLFNLHGKKQGWCDSPLTNRGQKQAEVARDYFTKRNIQFDYAFSSTSERACDTLEIVTDMPYRRIKGLKEWNFGTLEGEHEYLNPPLPYGNYFVQFGGESEQEFQQRFTATVRELVTSVDAGNVLIVAHGAACAQFMRGDFLSNSEEAYAQSLGMKNCCILTFRVENGAYTFLEKVNHDFSELN